MCPSGSSSSLTESVTFKNGKVSKNPFGLASLTNCQSNPDGTLADEEYKWLVRRAEGGFGIVNSCCVHVQANGKGWEGELGDFDDKHTEGLRRLAQGVQAHGALFIVQIFHAGMRSDDKLIEGPARSCVDTEYRHRAGVREVKGLDEDEIEQLIEDFVKAAKRVEEAGGDGVEIHGAHGYICTQFLCPDLNKRSDKWGGSSLENRARFTREVTKRIRKAVSPDFIVGVRLSPEPGYELAGWNMDPDENIQVAKWLVEDGADFISVSMFGHSPSHVTPKHKESGKPLIQEFREALPKEDVILMCCGGIKSGDDVQTLLNMGVDVAVMGKTAIACPDFPKQVMEKPSFELADHPPYTKDFLASVDVSPAFVGFLAAIGLVAQD